MALPPRQVYYGLPASDDHEPDREDIVGLHEGHIARDGELQSLIEATTDELSTEISQIGANAASSADLQALSSDLTAQIDSLAAAQASGYKFYATIAGMEADTSQAAGTRAWVDQDGANSGLYEFDGSVWTKIGDLPLTGSEANQRLAAAEQLRVASLRGWPVVPTFGGIAVPGTQPAAFDFTRATGTSRVNARGLVEDVAAGVVAQNYDADGAFLGWRVEPASTNSAHFSENFSDAYWTKARVTVTPNTAIAPDGTVTADKIEETSETGAHAVTASNQGTASPGDLVTVSAFVKAGERTKAYINVGGAAFVSGGSQGRGEFDLVSGVVEAVSSGITAGIEKYANGWWRIWAQSVATDAAGFGVQLGTVDDSGNHSGPGVAGSGIYIWGQQSQVGPLTAYLGTGATDVANNIAVYSRTIGSAPEGTIFARFSLRELTGGTQSIAGIWADGDNRAAISINPATGDVYGAVVLQSDVLQIGDTAIDVREEVWVALSWKPGEQIFAVNGVATLSGSPSSNALSGSTGFYLGSRDGVQAPANADIKEAFFFPRALSSEQMEVVTTPAFFSVGGGTSSVTATERRAIAGAVTESSFTAWSDFSAPDDVELVVSRHPDMWAPVFTSPVTPTSLTSGEESIYHSAMIEATGLDPDTRYYWQFRREGKATGPVRSVTTAPQPGVPASFSWISVSCSNVNRQTEHPIFEALEARQPAWLDHLGDLVYTNFANAELPIRRDQNFRNWIGGPSVSRMHYNIPLGVYMPDNHDSAAATGDWNTSYQDASYIDCVSATQEIYKETVPHHEFEHERVGGATAGTAQTLTQRRTWGRVRFLYPDTVAQRNYDFDTLLGADNGYEYWNQFQWLMDQLDEAEADNNIAAIVIEFTETWIGTALNGFSSEAPAEQTAICDKIATLTKPLFMIFGDIHEIGADDGTNADKSTAGNAKFMCVASSGLYEESGSYGAGPFEFNGVTTSYKAGDGQPIRAFVEFRITDDGVNPITLRAIGVSDPIDPETRVPTERFNVINSDMPW